MKHGLAVDERDAEGCTALHIAADQGCEALAALLLRHGADAEACDSNAKTPLYFAVCAGHNNVVDLLLSHKMGKR